MIDVALLIVRRRWPFREGPIRKTAPRTGLSRNTVREHLASGVVKPRYPKRKSPSKVDDYELTLTSWLFRESCRHRKQRRSMRQLHLDLIDLGYSGSYGRVAAFDRQWRLEHTIPPRNWRNSSRRPTGYARTSPALVVLKLTNAAR